jgi:hypothetical protein
MCLSLISVVVREEEQEQRYLGGVSNMPSTHDPTFIRSFKHYNLQCTGKHFRLTNLDRALTSRPTGIRSVGFTLVPPPDQAVAEGQRAAVAID